MSENLEILWRKRELEHMSWMYIYMYFFFSRLLARTEMFMHVFFYVMQVTFWDDGYIKCIIWYWVSWNNNICIRLKMRGTRTYHPWWECDVVENMYLCCWWVVEKYVVMISWKELYVAIWVWAENPKCLGQWEMLILWRNHPSPCECWVRMKGWRRNNGLHVEYWIWSLIALMNKCMEHAWSSVGENMLRKCTLPQQVI